MESIEVKEVVNREVLDYFKAELSYIYNDEIRNTVKCILNRAPDYMLTAPSSTTGKYHPQDEIAVGGKALHTRRVVWLAQEMCRMESYTPLEHDIIVAAAIVHDMYFKDITVPEREHSVKEHAELVRKYTETELGKLPYYNEIVSVAEKHSGQWGTTDELKPKQRIQLDKMLHICDYIASRRPIHIHVEGIKIGEPITHAATNTAPAPKEQPKKMGKVEQKLTRMMNKVLITQEGK